MEPFAIIRAMNQEAAEEIVEECKRLDIQYYYDASQDGVEDWPAGGYEVEIRETGLKGQELAEWVTARFDVEEEQDLYMSEGLIMKMNTKQNGITKTPSLYKPGMNEILKKLYKNADAVIYNIAMTIRKRSSMVTTGL